MLRSMGKWIKIVIIILMLVAGSYWFLQHEGVKRCQANGGEWDYPRWACNTG
jgi:hypothetical protein